MESSAVIGYPSGQDGAIINPLLTKLVWSRWLEASFFFCVFMDLDFINTQKRTWRISSHPDRTSLVNNICIDLSPRLHVFFNKRIFDRRLTFLG